MRQLIVRSHVVRWFSIKTALALGCLLLLFTGFSIYKQVVKIKKKQKITSAFVNRITAGGTSHLSVPLLGSLPTPGRFSNLRFADAIGIVVDVKSIKIGNLSAYNPSLAAGEEGYELFFRYDEFSRKAKLAPFSSRIGAVHLDDQFRVREESFQRIYLGSEYTEDPRVIAMGDKLYLFYNDLDQENLNCRYMCVANLDPGSLKVNYRTPLEANLRFVEKNWSPFVYSDPDQKERLLLEYQIYPRKLFHLRDAKEGVLDDVKLPRSVAYAPLKWEKIWGAIHGGTAAQKVGNEYLAFFHSAFEGEGGCIWFAMGAYTFETSPPFRLTGISSEPILFKGIFDTLLTHTAPMDKRVIFPGGFVVENKNGRAFVHVACGENDCGIKIVTMDVEKLKQNLTRFDN